MWCRYLLWFAHEHVEFRNAEMESILSLLRIPFKFCEKPCMSKPYWIVEVPCEDHIRKISSRSVLLKSCIELWSRAKSEQQLHENLKMALLNNTKKWLYHNDSVNSAETDRLDKTTEGHVCPSCLIEDCCIADKSFKVEIETFCKHFSMKEKINKIEKFDYLPLKGCVKLNNPDIKLMFLEFYGTDPNNVPEKPYDVFFGKWITDGQRNLIQRHSLKKRQFIGNTSMDAQLALLMANQAQVVKNDVVLDPFVGSGSLLVAAAHFGGCVFGSDIDFMMLHARTRPTRVRQKIRSTNESVKENLRQYDTHNQYLDVIVSDFALPLWREDVKFDAIITDPPYGVREPIEKIGIECDNYTLSEKHLSNHIPSKVEYTMPHLYSDLLHFATKHLEVGRRLVCWYPYIREVYDESQLPSHPCLKLVANSEQVLSKLTARRLLTYQRVQGNAPSEPLGSNASCYNFRDKYFAVGEPTRKEKKKKEEP